ncbi:MAG: PaaI family thioesterase [Burkholderiales bacterium]|nr:PaaI family thioesterase [Burkholderiales bacterium]
MAAHSKSVKSPVAGHVALTREMFGRGMPHAMGVRLVSVSPKKVVAEMPITSMHLNRSGRVNGGALMAFADILGAMGTIINLPPGYRTSTLESKTNFFAAGEGAAVTGVSIPLHLGRTTMVWQTTIKNPDGRKVAIVTQTQIVIPVKAHAAPAPTKAKPRSKK